MMVASAKIPPMRLSLLIFSLKNAMPMIIDSKIVDVLHIPYNDELEIILLFIALIIKNIEPKLNEPSNIPSNQVLALRKLRKVPRFTVAYIIPQTNDMAKSVAVNKAASSKMPKVSREYMTSESFAPMKMKIAVGRINFQMSVFVLLAVGL